ncbi:MAG: hypothetical protein R3F60_26085 [bacterium]
MRWRLTHNLLAAATLVAIGSGCSLALAWPRATHRTLAGAHAWLALAAGPLVLALLWSGRRRWLRRAPAALPTARALNRGLTRVTLVLLVVALATGLWVWQERHPRALIRLRFLHQLASEALLPAFALHVLLGLRAIARRRA